MGNDNAGWLAALIIAAVATQTAVVRAGQSPVTPETLLQALEHLEQARDLLVRSGDAAVAPAVAVLRGASSLNTLQVAVVVGALGELNSPRSRQALVALLADSRAEVAAITARVTARRGIECAVPALLQMLSDTRPYALETSTDPARTREVTVAEAADEALAQLTGASAKSRGRARIRGFERWWARHQRTARCEAGLE